MESYSEVRQSFGAFLGNVIHDMANQRTHIKDAQTVEVEGTSYEEINPNQSFSIDLKEYQTEILVHHNDIKGLNFALLRSRIYEASKKEARDMNEDFLKMLASEGLSVEAEKSSAIDAMLTLMKVYKKKGYNLDNLKIICSKKMDAKLKKELENPLNREKFNREWNKIKYESN